MTRRALGRTSVLAVALGAWLGALPGIAQTRLPDIGYVYPAGGQVGTTVQVTVGGQNLMGANAAFVTGGGVRASVVEYVRPLGPKQLGDIAKHLRVLIRQRMMEAQGLRGAGREQSAEELPPLPDHPLLRGLPEKTLEELRELQRALYDPKRQRNAQIAESVILKVTIDADASPGDRELRLVTPWGLSNPLCLQVGRVPEVCEVGAGGGQAAGAAPISLPAVINGQIMPGEVDRYRLQLHGGQRLVIAAAARTLIPYLADAVPGWFQAVLSLRDPSGREVAYVDDYRFHPDPIVFYPVPRDGEYLLEVRDALYRGREDFVYRISVGEQPFIGSVFPLGGKAGAPLTATVVGWNLPWQQVQLDTAVAGEPIRSARWQVGEWLSNPVQYAVDNLPELIEAEPNDGPDRVQSVRLPVIVNGRIGAPQDVDLFEFMGHGGEEVAVEVQARRLGSPLDSLVRLIDRTGTVVAWNDDFMEKEGDLHTGPGLLTHHADSYLLAKLPADGTYRVRLNDAQGQGGEEYAYRLRVSEPQPDFSVCVTPSSLSLVAGRWAPVTLHACRRDGFAGPIEVSRIQAAEGFKLAGAVIPAGQRSARATVGAPERGLDGPVVLELEARAEVKGATVVHKVTPAEDMMQAFLWRHLVPSQTLLALVAQPRRLAPTVAWGIEGPVRVPAGGQVRVPVSVARRPGVDVPVVLALVDPPAGLSMQTVPEGPGAMSVVLRADAELAGYSDNLIVEAMAELEFRQAEGGAARKQRVSLGVLPAIGLEVTQP